MGSPLGKWEGKVLEREEWQGPRGRQQADQGAVVGEEAGDSRQGSWSAMAAVGTWAVLVGLQVTLAILRIPAHHGCPFLIAPGTSAQGQSSDLPS